LKLAIARFEKDTLSVVEARGKKGIFRIAHKLLLIRPFFKAANLFRLHSASIAAN
jgi:hypothetical protein